MRPSPSPHKHVPTPLILITLLCSACSPSGPPYDPPEALGTFQIENGFRMELFAAEPDLADPVAMDIDEFGRIWVAENSGYPLDAESGAGRIKLLEDTDGDGRPDRTTLFADQLTMPTGVMAWKKGVLVTDAPHVWYLEDTDGDRRADMKRPVLSGFAFTNPQHTVSSPLYGLDNWIYLSHEGSITAVVFAEEFGDPGEEIHYPERPDGPRLHVDRRSLRFRPDTFELEYLAGPSQYGQTFDPWGRLFMHDNSNHVRHQVIAARYLERNPHLRVARALHDMSDHGNAAEVYPITVRPRFEILTDVGRITAASGLTLYLGGKFPAGFENVSFVAESAHNLVHRDVWSSDGVTFVAKRAREQEEFLASTDSWFRPVNFYIGPDGALYLIDYYREVIEHPEWTSAETYESEDIYHGKDRGRIYRIVPDTAEGLPLPQNIRLGEASDDELVRQLENPNIWWRRTAQRLLVDRQATAVSPQVTQVAVESPSAVARVHALWTLHGLGRLDITFIETALDDSEPGVRENALILAEAHLAENPQLVSKLLEMGSDPDPRVRFQLLCTLGEVESGAARDLRDKILFAEMEDPWMQVAALSWPSEQAASLFARATGARGLTNEETEGRTRFFEQVSSVIGSAGRPAEIRAVLASIAQGADAGGAWWRVAALEGLTAGLGGKKARQTFGASERQTLLRLFASDEPRLRRAALQALSLAKLDAADPSAGPALKKAARAAAAVAVDPERRADAIDLLALVEPQKHEAMLKDLTTPQTPEPVRAAAVRAFGKIEGEAPARFLLENWRSLTGPVRTEAAEAMYLSDDRMHLFVDAIERGDVQPWMLNFQQKRRLIMHADQAFRERARKLLTVPEEDRKKVLEEYQAALERDGDAARGREVFEEVCAKCHQLNGAGHEVGPDLATVQSRPSHSLLIDILLPNQSISQTYESYVVQTRDGQTLDGVMGPQSPTSITLRREEGEENVIERGNIESMYATNLSAMPADVEEQVSVQQMADLLRYIKTAR